MLQHIVGKEATQLFASTQASQEEGVDAPFSAMLAEVMPDLQPDPQQLAQGNQSIEVVQSEYSGLPDIPTGLQMPISVLEAVQNLQATHLLTKNDTSIQQPWAPITDAVPKPLVMPIVVMDGTQMQAISDTPKQPETIVVSNQVRVMNNLEAAHLLDVGSNDIASAGRAFEWPVNHEREEVYLPHNTTVHAESEIEAPSASNTFVPNIAAASQLAVSYGAMQEQVHSSEGSEMGAIEAEAVQDMGVPTAEVEPVLLNGAEEVLVLQAASNAKERDVVQRSDNSVVIVNEDAGEMGSIEKVELAVAQPQVQSHALGLNGGVAPGIKYGEVAPEARGLYGEVADIGEVAQQVRVHVAKGYAEGGEVVRFMLSPEELGFIEIRFERTSGGTDVRVLAERYATLDILFQTADQIQTSLVESGVKQEGLSLSFGMRENDGQNPGGSGGYAASDGAGALHFRSAAPIVEMSTIKAVEALGHYWLGNSETINILV